VPLVQREIFADRGGRLLAPYHGGSLSRDRGSVRRRVANRDEMLSQDWRQEVRQTATLSLIDMARDMAGLRLMPHTTACDLSVNRTARRSSLVLFIVGEGARPACSLTSLHPTAAPRRARQTDKGRRHQGHLTCLSRDCRREVNRLRFRGPPYCKYCFALSRRARHSSPPSSLLNSLSFHETATLSAR
jgi:hypothetical protein